MKHLFTLAALLISFFSFSQNPIETVVSNFNTIKTFDLVTVNLVKSNENKIIISGEDAQYVEYVQKNNILKIRMQTDKIFDGQLNGKKSTVTTR